MVAVGILMICFVVSKILLPVGWPPSWISGARRRSTKPEVPPLESMTPENIGVAVGILSLYALELKICLGCATCLCFEILEN